MLHALVCDAANLLTDMVDCLTNCEAYLSSEEWKTPREILLEIQSHSLQVLDLDRKASPPPPEKHYLHRAGEKRRADYISNLTQEHTL